MDVGFHIYISCVDAVMGRNLNTSDRWVPRNGVSAIICWLELFKKWQIYITQ